MKKVSIVSLIALIAIVISSCGSSNNVVNNNGISKRKYNKGFFFNRKSNLKTADAKVKEADFKENKAIAKAEKVETKKVRKAEKLNVAETTIASSDMVNILPVEEVQANLAVVEEAPETSAFLSDDLNDIEWSVTENAGSATGESVRQAPASNRNASTQRSSNRGAASSVNIVLLVILALFIPPLAVFLFEGVTGRFWIDLILTILGVGLGIGLGGLAYLAALAAVIYAVLIVLNVI